MRDVIEIRPEWLIEIAPHFYKKSDLLGDDQQSAKRDKNKVKLPPVAKPSK
jgi:hypothetical protein